MRSLKLMHQISFLCFPQLPLKREVECSGCRYKGMITKKVSQYADNKLWNKTLTESTEPFTCDGHGAFARQFSPDWKWNFLSYGLFSPFSWKMCD